MLRPRKASKRTHITSFYKVQTDVKLNDIMFSVCVSLSIDNEMQGQTPRSAGTELRGNHAQKREVTQTEAGFQEIVPVLGLCDELTDVYYVVYKVIHKIKRAVLD